VVKTIYFIDNRLGIHIFFIFFTLILTIQFLLTYLEVFFLPKPPGLELMSHKKIKFKAKWHYTLYDSVVSLVPTLPVIRLYPMYNILMHILYKVQEIVFHIEGKN